MEAMPRPRPPFLHRQTTRHGRAVWYVRIQKGSRIRLRAEYGTSEFWADYEAAIAGKLSLRPITFNAQSLGWLIERYRDSTAWAKLSQATRRQRERVLSSALKTAGKTSLSRIDCWTIERGIERRNPYAARHFLQAMRGLFQWAVKAKLASNDPTAELKVILPATEGHPVWTEDDCRAFEARWPRGTRERVAFDILLYTGLRRGDAVRLGRPHVKNGIATIRTEKTGQVVSIPLLPPLQATLDAGPIGGLTFIAGERGGPMKKESFGTWFAAACKQAGVSKSAHGLRKAGATRAANNGASEAQLEAFFGWRGGGMASLYTREANRAKLARDTAAMLLPERDENIYSLTSASGEGVRRNRLEKPRS